MPCHIRTNGRMLEELLVQLQGTAGGSAATMEAAGGEPMAPERRVHFQEATAAAGSSLYTGVHTICVHMGSRHATEHITAPL